MSEDDFKNLTADELKAYMAKNHEKEYLLVDVRQPFEYEEGHIPGAHFLPLMKLEANLYGLPSDRSLVFYCRSGARSAAAASLAVDGEVTTQAVFNLQGGILAWDGHQLADYPRLEIFPNEADFDALLKTAMNLEKGAHNFYQLLLAHPALDSVDLQTILTELAAAEEGHARLIYAHWKRSKPQSIPFEKLFADLAGDIVEGGHSLADWVKQLREHDSGQGGLAMIEMAMQIEYSAYDLYRNLAEKSGSDDIAVTLRSVAQAEKAHLHRLVDAVRAIPNIDRI